MAMLGSDIREILEAIIPEEALGSLLEAAKFRQRERKCEATRLIRAVVLAASSGRGGRLADVMFAYFESEAAKVARSSFYRWFGPALEQVMMGISQRALHYARAQTLDLPGALGKHVRDWHIVDSTTVQLPHELIDEYQGTGDYAALKIHKRFSVGVGTTVDYKITAAHEHDASHFAIDESWRGLGILFDLGYASMRIVRECEQHDVRYVMRLKNGWKPKVVNVVRGTITKTFVPGTDLDVLLEAEALLLDGRIIDADVLLGPQRTHARLVGVPTPKGYCFFLTNLEPSVAPSTVADLYRVRWEIEMDNKLDKSSCRLDEITAKTAASARALVHASMIASIIVCLLTHRHRLRSAPPPKHGAERKAPPIHAQSIVRAIAWGAPAIAQALELQGAQADAYWEARAERFNSYTDPNWRNRPSVLDQMRGWKISPAKKRKSRKPARISTASAP
jgi:hypothetical protein